MELPILFRKHLSMHGVIANWMRNRNTIEFLGIWECLYNPSFKPLEFEGFRKEAGFNAFTLSPKKWVGYSVIIHLFNSIFQPFIEYELWNQPFE